MPLTQRELTDIERAHTGGLSSRQILEVLDAHGQPITEATLRKYVQLGLLPRSRRVGEKGKHRGSHGIYPVEVIRRIDEIRRAMTDGETLESLARATQGVRSKLVALRASVTEALESAGADLDAKELERAAKRSLESELAAIEKQARAWMKAIEKWAGALDDAGKANGTKTAAKRPRRPGGV